MKVWSCKDDVREDVEMLKRVYQTLHYIPPHLRKAMEAKLMYSYKDCIIEFYRRCPMKVLQHILS